MAAFDAVEELETYKAVYAQNRAMLLEELPRAGFDRLAPADGAFYLYADVRNLTDDSESFVQRILKETGVAVTPGIDFDEEEGRHFVRFSYAGPFADMREAARRLRGVDEAVGTALLGQLYPQRLFAIVAAVFPNTWGWLKLPERALVGGQEPSAGGDAA